MPALTIYDDLPTLEDKLGWDSELERLSQRIQGCSTPHVLGIHGDWGCGKTSFMRQLQRRLGGDKPDDGSVAPRKPPEFLKDQRKLQKKIVTIWFDAWRYQNEPVPVVALLQEMRRQISGAPWLKGRAKKIGEITVRYALNSLADIAKSIGAEGLPSAEKVEALGNAWEKEHYAQELTTDSLREHLHDSIECLLPNNDDSARVVVFIDDLDRCSPKAAIRLLEGLKIYLTIPRCVFVLGTNERVLVDAIREEISAPKDVGGEELKLRAAHYVEKICTDIYRLPLPSDPVRLFSEWIRDVNQRQTLITAIDTMACLPPNPRRLKALANQWERFARCILFPVTGVAEQEVWAVRVLVAAYIHQFHRDLWERWHFNPDFWMEFMRWCNGENAYDDEGKHLSPPQWASALKFTEQVNLYGTWTPHFPNPGDIDIFWLDGLIRKYRDQLKPLDFKPLLRTQT